MNRYTTQPDYIFEIPPVKNPLVYIYRICAKIFCFCFFGLGSGVLGIVALPFMKILWPQKKDFQKHARILVSRLFRFFIWFMTVLHICRFKVENKERLRDAGGCVVVANHPSLLDVVMLISILPNADCIVNASLKKNIVGAIVAYLYITNDYEHEELIEKCVESINNGNALIIFPEGTRTKPEGQNQYKKGAARVALAAKCPVIPVFMGGNDKLGLRKKDPMLLFNHTDPYIYNLYVKPEISMEEFSELPPARAAKQVTDRMKDVLCYENNWDKIIGKNPLRQS